MMLWVVISVITCLTIFGLSYPLLRRAPGAQERRGHYLSVYRNQLNKIETDHAGGLLNEEQAGAALKEIEQRIVAACDAADKTAPVAAPKNNWLAMLAIILFMPVGAILLYHHLG